MPEQQPKKQPSNRPLDQSSDQSEKRQRVLVLYLSSSALDARVIGWANYDGSSRTDHMAGDESEPPYKTGLQALQDGWRLIQASPLVHHAKGEEFRTSYLKYEFFFEKLVVGQPIDE
jgi:hypothetical protein